MIDKELIKKNFSAQAKYYDRYCSVQNAAAEKLINKITNSGDTNSGDTILISEGREKYRNKYCVPRILDVGCGTGNYTSLLRERFPAARIKALDISSQMLVQARAKLKDKQIDFMLADGEELSGPETFDLISSNATLQWFQDLEKALLNYSRLLNPDGRVAFSLLGPLTFCELSSCLEELSGQTLPISSSNFIDQARAQGILSRIFKESAVSAEQLTETYSSLRQLLVKIKYTGARGQGKLQQGLWTQAVINKLERLYQEKFGGIHATYEIIFCQGLK